MLCRVLPFPARPNFEFQFWAGYDIAVPMKQFEKEGRERPMAIAVKVTPDQPGAKGTYLFSRAAFPSKIPPELWAVKNAEMNLGGGFLVGMGKYQVELWVMDSAQRSCYRRWKVEANDTSVPTKMSRNEVRDSGFDSWEGLQGGSGTVSVYVHAAAFVRRRITTKLSAWDRAVLLGSLRSLLEVGGFARARVKVFHLDGRRVLFEREDFSKGDFEQLMDVLMGLNLGTVSYETLKGPNEEVFLTGLMGEEAARDSKSDAVVFLGPTSRSGPKLSPLARELSGQLPPLHYLALTPWFSVESDLIERFVKAGPGGRVHDVYQPADLAKGIREIRGRLN
ncbi:MAG: hypothetical protein ACK6DX_07985 [Acidobacteriota bacterium]